MAIKVQEAEKMNEINDLYDDLRRQKKENELRAMASDLSAASAASMASLAGAETGAFGGQYFPARKRVAIRANAGGTHRVALTPGGDVRPPRATTRWSRCGTRTRALPPGRRV